MRGSTTDIDLIASILSKGQVTLLPTDTVYGLCAAAAHPAAVANMYAIKQRVGKPGTVIAASLE